MTALPRALFVIIIAATALLRIHAVGMVREPGPDSFHYAREAQIVLSQGTAGLRMDAARFRSDASMWGVPPPWRAGFLYAAAGWMAITGERGPKAVAHFAAWTDVLTAILLGLLAWRISGPWQAIAAIALYTVSPPVLQMARHGWEEPLLGCAGMAMLLFAAFAVEKSEWWWSALLGLLAGFALSIKEAAFINGLVIAAFACVTLALRKDWYKVGYLCAAFTLSTLACGWWLAEIAGGAAQLIALLGSNVAHASAIPYAVAYQSGGLSKWLYTIWQCDPILSILGALGIAATLAASRRQPAMVWASGIALVFLALPLAGPNLLNMRFSSAAMAPLCLLGAHALFTLHGQLTRIAPPRMARAARLSLACYIAAVVALDVNWYQSLFEKPDLPDLSAGIIAGSGR